MAQCSFGTSLVSIFPPNMVFDLLRSASTGRTTANPRNIEREKGTEFLPKTRFLNGQDLPHCHTVRFLFFQLNNNGSAFFWSE